MSLNHGSMTTHIPQSLPSFAQAFSSPSLNSISSGNNSLPPIQGRPPSIEHRRVNTPSARESSRPPSTDVPGARFNSRKRARNDPNSSVREDDNSGSDQSPRIVRIKEESDHDMLESSPPAPVESSIQDSGAPPPSSLIPSPSKKRRVTISGAPHPLNIDTLAPPADPANSTPISPVVMGLSIMRDDPAAIEQVRSMLTVKQKQKALIEQRRGSVAGIVTAAGVNGTTNSPAPAPPPPPEERPAVKSPPAPRTAKRSPTTASAANRRTQPATGSNVTTTTTRPPSPSPIIVPSQQPQTPIQLPGTMSANSLPPPPISFARRRAGQFGPGKKKPADIIISPREPHTKDQLQPVIQSAPPVPHAGQSQYYTGRFPMTLPRLPSVMVGGDNVRKVMAQVPPTPTRLAMHRNAASTGHLALPTIPGISGRSPPAASVPISTTLVPPTPASLHHPGYSGDKSAFLAPFEVFYDALNDSKQLKNWLGEQLQRSNALMQTLSQQQEKLDDVVNAAVEKRVGGMKEEIHTLHRRVEELEDILRVARSDVSSRHHSSDSAKAKSKQPSRSGLPPGPTPPETYTFPPVAQMEPLRRRPDAPRRLSSPGWRQDRETENLSVPEGGSSPKSYDSRRLSVSSIRLDPPRNQPGESSMQRRGSFVVQSPPQGFREVPSQGLAPPSHPPHSKGQTTTASSSNAGASSWSSQSLSAEAHRQQPHARFRYPAPESSGEGKASDRATPPPRVDGSRRNSVAMSPPDRPRSGMDES